MTGFYKDYADSSDTHQNSAEASADAAEVSATGAATSASEAATSASEAATSASEAATSLAAQEDLEVTSASFDTTDGTLTLTKANSGTVTTDLDGRYLTTHQDITGKADLSGADFTGDVTITNGELTVNGSAEAELFKGDIEGAVHFKGAEASGATLAKGDVVYVSGHSGQKTEVDLADASDSSKMPAFGIVAADPNGVNVDVVTFGTLKSIDTSTYTDGDELYVDTTAGGLTATAPSGEGNLVQKIAKVVKAHNSGNIKVMGAGRTNATPNLNDGNIFIGDSNNVATTASFTTEVANATTGKADLSGATFTGQVYFNDHARVPDDKQLFFGASGDLRLSHSSSNNTSYIGESGTGSLVIYGTDLYLKDSLSGGNRYLYGNSGAETTLYFNGDEKLSTTNTGVNFTGNVTTTGTLATGGYTLSSTDGTSGQALVTDGSGNVSFDDVTVDVSGKADLSGATFTGDITAKSKLIVNKQPVASDLLTTSRSIQDLAAWSIYGGTGSNYALTPEKYRDSFDVNQDNRFSSADAFGISLFVQGNYTSAEYTTYNSLLSNPSNITSTFVQDVIDGDYDSLSTSAGVTIDMDASSIVAVDGNVSVDGNITVTGDISAVDDFGADSASFTGDVSLSDNGKIKLGDDDNLQIYHNPTNNTSYINNAGGNDLTVKTDGLYLKSADNTKAMLNASQSGAVNLFHDGDIKLETRDDGVRVTGNIAVDGTVDGVDVAGLSTTVTGKANLSGATFTGNVAIGIPPSGTQSLTVAGTTNLYGGITGDLDVTGTVTAPNVDISTTGSVTTNIASGVNNGNATDVKVVNIGTGYGTGFFAGDSTTINMGGQDSSAKNIFNIGNGVTSGSRENTINLKGNVTVDGKITGSTDGVVLEHDKSADLEPVLELQNTRASGNGYRGAFISMTGYNTSGTEYTRGVIGMGSSTAQYSFPYIAANVTSVSCGIKLSGSSSTSYNALTPCNSIGASANNGMQCGHPFYKWNTVYATNGNIATSDQTHKRDVEELSEAETRVAIACKGLLRKYRWKDAYEEKGEEARIHFGIMAQDLRDAFSAEGLDASRYAMFCSDTWWEDETGERHEEQDLAPEGTVETTQLGVRYDELLAFIIAAI